MADFPDHLLTPDEKIAAMEKAASNYGYAKAMDQGTRKISKPTKDEMKELKAVHAAARDEFQRLRSLCAQDHRIASMMDLGTAERRAGEAAAYKELGIEPGRSP